MLTVFLCLLGAFILLVPAPAFALLMHLTRHWRIRDFDLMPPERLENSQYAPYLSQIFGDMEYMRSLKYENVSVTADDGTSLRGRLTGNSDRLILLAHGFHTTPFNNFASIARAYVESGFSVLLIDERGHGESEGHTTFALKEERDMLAWAAWAQSEERFKVFAFHGISMGGAALIMASDRLNQPKLRALVCDCAYYCLNVQMAKVKQMQSLPARIISPFLKLFMRLIYGEDSAKDGLKALAKAQKPIVFLAGGADGVVSAETVMAAKNACASQSEYFYVPEARHTLVCIAGGDELRGRLINYLNEKFSETE